MAQALCRRPLTAEVQVRAGSVHVWFVVDRVALGQRFIRVLQFSPVIIIPPRLSVIIIWGMNNMPIGDRSSETSSHHIDVNIDSTCLLYWSIFCLFNDAASNSDYIASNEIMIDD
jgi:hypothetical protein